MVIQIYNVIGTCNPKCSYCDKELKSKIIYLEDKDENGNKICKGWFHGWECDCELYNRILDLDHVVSKKDSNTIILKNHLDLFRPDKVTYEAEAL